MAEEHCAVEGFVLPGSDKKAVILLHGYSGAPAEMRLLGNYLHDFGGYTVIAPLLPGHGTDAKNLSVCRCQDWYEAVAEVVADTVKKFPQVAIAGQSLGALLALKAADEFTLRSVVLLSLPVFLQDRRAAYASILRYFIPYIKKRTLGEAETRIYRQGYDKMPTAPVPDIMRLMKRCREKYIREIKEPVLIIQSRSEHTVNPKGAEWAFENLDSLDEDKKEILWLNKSQHVVTLGRERESVFRKTLEFMEKYFE